MFLRGFKFITISPRMKGQIFLINSKDSILNDVVKMRCGDRGRVMKSFWKCVFFYFLLTSCGPFFPEKDKPLALGTAEEKNAVAVVKRLAIQHGYRPEKMNLEVNRNSGTGDFLIFLFPKPIDTQHLQREFGLFAIVQAKTGTVIRFSDPAMETRKKKN